MKPSISYAIGVCNEIIEINRLLPQILQTMNPQTDEIIILADEGNISSEINNYLFHIENLKFWLYTNPIFIGLAVEDKQNILDKFSSLIKIYQHKLNGDFAAHKNYMNDLCSKDYIFNIDADELFYYSFLINIHEILEANEGIDIIWLPRKNFVLGVPDKELKTNPFFISQKYNDKGFGGYPDFQGRLFKNDKSIYWVGKVHEKLIGFTTIATLPPNDEYDIIHIKSYQKQMKQNELYSKITG